MRRNRFSGQKYCFILDDGNKTLDCGNDRHNLFFIVTMTPDRLFKPKKQKEGWEMADIFREMEDIEVMEVTEASLLGEAAASLGVSSCASCSCCGSTSCISCGIGGASGSN